MGTAHRGEFTKANAHPAIVDAALWHRAQVPRRVPSKAIRHDELFRGYMRCAGCRMKLSGKYTKGHLYWVCTPRKAMGRCPAPASVRASALEAHVLAALKQRIAHLARANDERPLTAARTALERAEAAVSRYRDNDTLELTLGPARHLAGLKSRMSTVQRAALEVARLQDREPALRDAGVDWDALNHRQRKAVIGRQLDCVFVHNSRLDPRDRAFICWRGEAPPDLPRRGAAAGPISDFNPDSCLGAAATRRRPRAFQPRWPLDRLESGLRTAVAEHGYLGDKTQLRRWGHADVWMEMTVTGGRTVWGRRLDLPIAPAKRPPLITAERLDGELLAYLSTRTDPTAMPHYRDFCADNQRRLWQRLVARGGLQHWAARHHLSYQPQHATPRPPPMTLGRSPDVSRSGNRGSGRGKIGAPD